MEIRYSLMNPCAQSFSDRRYDNIYPAIVRVQLNLLYLVPQTTPGSITYFHIRRLSHPYPCGGARTHVELKV